MIKLTRRHFLAGSGVAAASTLPSFTVAPARAAAPASGRQAAGFYRYKIGSFEITAINDGTWERPFDEKFIRNATLAEIRQALTDGFQPTDRVPTPFTTSVVNTGAKLVLLDTGTGGQFTHMAPRSGTWSANFAAAGFDPKAVDTVVISHFHADHINGIKTKDGDRVFPNAEIMVPAPEWAFWMDDAKLNAASDAAKNSFRNARRIFADIARDVTPFEPGKDVAPGISSIPAHGHTPGHCAFVVASGNESALYVADSVIDAWLFLRHPDWQVIDDMDGDLAAAVRKKLLARASADRMQVQGYHFPFPGLGHITKTAKGYDFVPAMWQPSP